MSWNGCLLRSKYSEEIEAVAGGCFVCLNEMMRSNGGGGLGFGFLDSIGWLRVCLRYLTLQT